MTLTRIQFLNWPWEEKPCFPWAYAPWEASFSTHGLIFGGEEISTPETRPNQKSYNCSNVLDMRNLQEQVKKAFCLKYCSAQIKALKMEKNLDNYKKIFFEFFNFNIFFCIFRNSTNPNTVQMSAFWISISFSVVSNFIPPLPSSYLWPWTGSQTRHSDPKWIIPFGNSAILEYQSLSRLISMAKPDLKVINNVFMHFWEFVGIYHLHLHLNVS